MWIFNKLGAFFTDAVLDKYVKKWNVRTRLLAAGIPLILGALYVASPSLMSAMHWMQLLVRAVSSQDEPVLGGDRRKSVDRAVKQLSRRLSDDYSENLEHAMNRNHVTDRYSAWNMAQVLVAIDTYRDDQNLSKVRLEDSRTAINAWMNKACNCWHERPANTHTPHHIGVSAWVLFSLSWIGLRPDSAQIEFILANQMNDGSWPMYPFNSVIEGEYLPNSDRGSTYATAWCVLALNDLATKSLLHRDVNSDRVEKATRNAIVWLKTNRLKVPDQARWHAYPQSLKSKGLDPSLSLSGLVIHALASVGRGLEEEVEIAKLWLADLPELPKNLHHWEVWANYVDYYDSEAKKNVREKEDVRNLTFPWIAIATVDSYAHGGVFDRISALSLLDQIADRVSDIESKLDTQYTWISAELVIALRHIQGDYKHSQKGN